MDQPDPSRLRISDQDRHRVAELLREAAAEGRLDLDELDERLEAAYAAKVYADLVPLTSDLPGPHASLQPLGETLPVPRPAPGLPATVSHHSSVAIMSGVDRKGVWQIGSTHTAFSMMGAVVLDLRQARFTATETIINANTLMGSVDVYVNAGTHVVVEGFGVMGAFDQARDKVPADLRPDSPVVRVKGVAIMGAVTVTRKQMPGEPGKIKKMLGH
jgi:hypothetical protein